MEAQFAFDQVPQAFQKLEEGHARGKTVVMVAKEDDRESEELVQNGRMGAAEPERHGHLTAEQN